MRSDLDERDVARLRWLEDSLWRPEARFDRAHMERTLASDFSEIGRSGHHWTREQCLGEEASVFSATLPLPSFDVRSISPGVALVTYMSETTAGGETTRTLRSSLWSKEGGDWQLRFHQGTPLAGN